MRLETDTLHLQLRRSRLYGDGKAVEHEVKPMSFEQRGIQLQMDIKSVDRLNQDSPCGRCKDIEGPVGSETRHVAGQLRAVGRAVRANTRFGDKTLHLGIRRTPIREVCVPFRVDPAKNFSAPSRDRKHTKGDERISDHDRRIVDPEFGLNPKRTRPLSGPRDQAPAN